MTQAASTALSDLQIAGGAQFRGANLTATSYGDVCAEYDALTNHAAIVDRSHLARVEHRGIDALDLLHRLTTNELLSLTDGSARQTVLTSERGRVTDVFTVVRRSAADLLLLSESMDAAALIGGIDRFTIIEDAELTDVSRTTSQFSVVGPATAGIVEAAVGPAASRLQPGGHATSVIDGVTVDIVRTDALGGPEWEVVVPVAESGSVWQALTTAGARPAGIAAHEIRRVERGVPAPGSEITDAVNPLEMGLMPLISFTKGCYVGQEVIARLDTYDKVQRRLVGLRCDDLLTPDDALTDGDRAAGRVTSVAESFSMDAPVALGIVRKDWAEPGTRLESPSGPVTVAELPFV